MKLSIAVYVLNQRDSIVALVDQLGQLNPPGWEVELVVVDGNSNDGTRKALWELTRPNLQVVYPFPNDPVTWQQMVTLHASGDYILFDRALYGHPQPRERLGDLTNLLVEAAQGYVAIFSAPIMRGARSPQRDAVTKLINATYGCKLDDVPNAVKIIRTDYAKVLHLHEEGLNFEVDLTVKLLRAGVSIGQVPSSLHTELPSPKLREQVAALRALIVAGRSKPPA